MGGQPGEEEEEEEAMGRGRPGVRARVATVWTETVPGDPAGLHPRPPA